MGRRVNTLGLQATGGSVDGFFDKIIKYIPSDIVALWTGAIGLITAGGSTAKQNETVLWIAFAVVLVLTAVWTWYQTKAPGQPIAIKHIIAATISFAVWAIALPGGPASNIPSWDAKWGSLLLMGWTFVLGMIPPDPTKPPATPGP